MLAGYLGVEALRNQVLDEVASLADRMNSVPSPDDTREMWGEGMGEGDGGLRRLCLDLFAGKRTESLIVGHEDSW